MVKKETNEVEAPNTGALVTQEDKKNLAAIQMAGGGDQNSYLNLPILRLEHTTGFDGEPNPLKGQFTLSRKNELGEWDKTELGELITGQFILQRYFLSMSQNQGKVKYSSREFDTPTEKVILFKSETVDGKRKSTPYHTEEKTSDTLSKDFLTKKVVDGKEQIRSDLSLLYVLYLKLEGVDEIVKWKTNVSTTVGWSRYQKSGVVPFSVITEVTREEATAGSNKYFRPNFRATEPLKDFKKVLAGINELRGQLSQSNGGTSVKPVEDENNA